MNQSELEGITHNRCQAGEKECDIGTIGFCLFLLVEIVA